MSSMDKIEAKLDMVIATQEKQQEDINDLKKICFQSIGAWKLVIATSKIMVYIGALWAGIKIAFHFFGGN